VTTIQIIFLALVIPATLYQVLKVQQFAGLVAHYGEVRLTVPLRLILVLTIAIQVAFVLTLTDNITANTFEGIL